MWTKKKYEDDLDYLAGQGYDKVAVKASDLAELTKKVRAKTFSPNKGNYLILFSLLIGVIIGGLVFLLVSKKSEPSAGHDFSINSHTSKSNEPFSRMKTIDLDTVLVATENFVNPSSKNSYPLEENTTMQAEEASAVEPIVSIPVDATLLTEGVLREDKLKYMINSQVFYLHDLKITNYTTLYFKMNKFVNFTGLSAEYSTKNGNVPAGSSLKQNANYYLHEEIAQAMLHFKKERYDQAITTLKLVSTYNDNDLNCDFYLAMCYYYKKNYNKALELYDLCIDNSNNAFLEEALFYKAVTLEESGRKEEARILFKRIVEENSFYKKKAESFLGHK
jgi:hypothetical protein